MIRFRHADAMVTPKPHRPATVAGTPVGGRYLLFYGSTFKHGRAPREAIVIDPHAPSTEIARGLADAIGEVIDECTYFHGSMMSETHSSDNSVKRFATRFPVDPFEDLQEQGEDLLLAFGEAWRRLTWISPAQRAFVLNALWWELQFEVSELLALTLLLYDGLTPSQIAATQWGPTVEHSALLPRTRSLIERHRGEQVHRDAQVFGDATRVRVVLEHAWDRLREHAARARPKVHLPVWSRVPDPDRSS